MSAGLSDLARHVITFSRMRSAGASPDEGGGVPAVVMNIRVDESFKMREVLGIEMR
jgi:hypothetical protein